MQTVEIETDPDAPERIVGKIVALLEISSSSVRLQCTHIVIVHYYTCHPDARGRLAYHPLYPVCRNLWELAVDNGFDRTSKNTPFFGMHWSNSVRHRLIVGKDPTFRDGIQGISPWLLKQPTH